MSVIDAVAYGGSSKEANARVLISVGSALSAGVFGGVIFSPFKQNVVSATRKKAFDATTKVGVGTVLKLTIEDKVK